MSKAFSTTPTRRPTYVRNGLPMNLACEPSTNALTARFVGNPNAIARRYVVVAEPSPVLVASA
jgi:hypothetical protein